VCVPGYYGNNGSACAECERDAYCASGVRSQCPGNSSSPARSGVLSSCSCNAGYFGFVTSCGECPVASYCPGGFYSFNCTGNATTASTRAVNYTECFCDRGFAGTNNTPCVPCPAGSWCWTGVVNPCPQFTTSPPYSNYWFNCTCNLGYQGSDGGPCGACGQGSYKTSQGAELCVLCDAGFYSAAYAATSQATCSLCGLGAYQGQRGASLCLLCSAGRYQDVPGASACSYCGAGKYQTGAAMESPNNCTRCGRGTFQTGVGLVSAANCSLCSEGTYQDTEGAASPSQCRVCAGGTYQTGLGRTAQNDCLVCEFGGYCLGGLIYDCPAHTNSSRGASSVWQCWCEAGRACKAVKDIRASFKAVESRNEVEQRRAQLVAQVQAQVGTGQIILEVA